MSKMTNDLANWMGDLVNTLKSIPIIYLAIPGSHDSMSYGMSASRARVAPDAVPIVGKLCKVMPCVIRRWAITQCLDATQQLKAGIRYLDLRISLSPKDHRFYFVHGLYCEEISKPLEEIRQFLDDHPQEFVIFDCQHFYLFGNEDYARLERILLDTFKDKFYAPSDGKLNELSLFRAHSLKKQLLVVYRHNVVPTEFWPSDAWPTPWPNQFQVKKLQNYLDTMIKYRSPQAGYVSQCVLTPPVKFILPRFYSSLRKKCAARVIKGLADWIKSQRPGPFNASHPTTNVFIADFIEMNDNEFCKVVIDLNQKILEECKLHCCTLNDDDIDMESRIADKKMEIDGDNNNELNGLL